ncbi:hypothetical protein QUC31_007242 [Theobroma cacao]|uniref:Myb-related protein 308 n=2 Tax=Theobroma cacao TaxID=3641 RepID=A0AB32VD79_THECC|nr:PREDICTED: myb-related protein 308 [Theobroma cacao]EOY21235.1 R2R3 MYB C2 repressor 2 protein [Theobroma cacao]WRX18359.1 SANT/Myb domain - like 10 [Theobroma cacao]
MPIPSLAFSPDFGPLLSSDLICYLHWGFSLFFLFPMRKPCCEKKETNKGAWSKLEDQKLIDYIQKHGEGCWRYLPQAAGLLRCGKSCRLRWVNYLRPDLKRGNFGEDEEELIIKLHALLGNRWSLIAGRLPGRTDNEVKNYWNTHIKRKLLQKGIDPNNRKLVLSSISIAKSKMSNESNSSTVDSGSDDSNQDMKFASGSESNTMSSLPDLNLDLTIAPPPPLPLMEERQLINLDSS